MHITPESLKRLEAQWLSEGWNPEAVRGTINGMHYDILSKMGAEWLASNAGPERPTTPTSASTCGDVGKQPK